MYCLKCGKQVEDDVKACPFCGAPTENASQYEVDQMAKDNKTVEGLLTASMVLGIIGCVVAWLFALLGYMFGGASLAICLVSKSKDRNNPKNKKVLIISIAALVCSAISSIIGVILMS